MEDVELNGRRLIVLPAVRREDVEKVKKDSKLQDKGGDRRGVRLLKEGLTNITDFVNKVIANVKMRIGRAGGRNGTEEAVRI